MFKARNYPAGQVMDPEVCVVLLVKASKSTCNIL